METEDRKLEIGDWINETETEDRKGERLETRALRQEI